jgi:GntR family transcriptional regulator
MINNEAIYIQLKNSLKSKILRGDYCVGDKLDSERSMAEKYGINRQTVRKAIKFLENEEYLVTIQGKGTFVAKIPPEDNRIDVSPSGVISLSAEIRQQGFKASRDIISFARIDHQIQKERFPNSYELYEIIRLSKINDKPYALQESYIPANRFPDADRYDFSEGSLYEYMGLYDMEPKKVVSYLRIDKAPEKYARLLEHSENKNLFVFDYLGYDKSDELVEYTLSYHLPQYTKFKYLLKRP